LDDMNGRRGAIIAEGVDGLKESVGTTPDCEDLSFEVRAISDVEDALECLDEKETRRVLEWAISKFLGRGYFINTSGV